MSSKSKNSIAEMELSRYQIVKRSRDAKQEEIEVINANMRSIKAGSSDSPVRGGGGGNKLDGLIDRKTQLTAEVEYATAFLEYVEHNVDRLPEKEGKILRRFFLDGLTSADALEAIMNETAYESRWIWQLRRNAIEMYDEMIAPLI